jgi:hypothetical protein
MTRLWCSAFIVTVASVAGFGQAAAFNLNNDTNTHTFSLYRLVDPVRALFLTSDIFVQAQAN